MYINKCSKCGKEFETKNPKRVICPACLYPDRNPLLQDDGQNQPKDEQQKQENKPEGEATQASSGSYSSSGDERPQRSYNNYNSDDRQGGQGGYNRNYGDRQGGQGGYNRDGGGYNRNYGDRQSGYNRNYGDRQSGQGGQGGYNRSYGDRQGGYNRPQGQGGYNRDGGGYNRNYGDRQGGYNRPQGQGGQGGYNRDGGYNRNYGDRQGGYNRPQGQGGQGGYNRDGGGFNRSQGGGFRRPGGGNRRPPVRKALLVSREQVAMIEVLYKRMLPLPNPDAHEVIGTEIGLEPNKVFFGINLVRQKLHLPKLPFPKRKLAISPEQLMAIKSLYEPMLPLPPIGCHKILAAQLKMDEWRVHVGIGLIRKQMGLDRWNQDREDAPEEYKNANKDKEPKAKKED